MRFIEGYDYDMESVIYIVETALDLPVSSVSSSVPISMLLTFTFSMNFLLVISATSTAVVIARPLAFNTTS